MPALPTSTKSSEDTAGRTGNLWTHRHMPRAAAALPRPPRHVPGKPFAGRVELHLHGESQRAAATAPAAARGPPRRGPPRPGAPPGSAPPSRLAPRRLRRIRMLYKLLGTSSTGGGSPGLLQKPHRKHKGYTHIRISILFSLTFPFRTTADAIRAATGRPGLGPGRHHIMPLAKNSGIAHQSKPGASRRAARRARSGAAAR